MVEQMVCRRVDPWAVCWAGARAGRTAGRLGDWRAVRMAAHWAERLVAKKVFRTAVLWVGH